MKKLTLLLGLLSSFLLADIKFETSQLEELREIVERPHKKIFIFVVGIWLCIFYKRFHTER